MKELTPSRGWGISCSGPRPACSTCLKERTTASQHGHSGYWSRPFRDRGTLYLGGQAKPGHLRARLLGTVGAAIADGPFVRALANYSYINSLSRGAANALVISQGDKCRSAALLGSAIPRTRVVPRLARWRASVLSLTGGPAPVSDNTRGHPPDRPSAWGPSLLDPYGGLVLVWHAPHTIGTHGVRPLWESSGLSSRARPTPYGPSHLFDLAARSVLSGIRGVSALICSF